MGLFDEHHLFSFNHSEFHGERLIACRNPALAVRCAQKSVDAEAALNGLYVIRSNVIEQRMDDAQTVRNYKSLR